MVDLHSKEEEGTAADHRTAAAEEEDMEEQEEQEEGCAEVVPFLRSRMRWRGLVAPARGGGISGEEEEGDTEVVGEEGQGGRGRTELSCLVVRQNGKMLYHR